MSPADRPDRPSVPLTPPASLRPPGTAGQAANPDRGAQRGVWLTLAVLLLLALGVVLVLPQKHSDSVRSEPVPEPAQPPPAAESAGAPAAAREQAEQTLQQYLRLQAELRLMQAPVWGAGEWEAAAAQVSQGDRLFGERRFAAAQLAYARALAALQALEASRSARLQEALAAGRQALNDGHDKAAQAHFEQALLVEADNAEAAHGLARARVRARVLEAVAAGAEAEVDGRFDDARNAYQAALALDPTFAEARSGLAQSEEMLAGEAFKDAMSRALAALDAKRFDAADLALDQAAAIRPQATALGDARARLRAARRTAAVTGLREAAAARAAQEDWQGATERYRKVLQIDPGAGFAREGLTHAGQRAGLNRQFDHYLNDPARLYSDEPLANAERLLQEVPQAPPEEPVLAAKIDKLRAAVSAAQQPLSVTLRSDGDTEVVIYHVGRLGRFVDRTLELRPGTYTALGSRPGFRDVRRVFTLQPGQPSPTLDIRCEEPV